MSFYRLQDGWSIERNSPGATLVNCAVRVVTKDGTETTNYHEVWVPKSASSVQGSDLSVGDKILARKEQELACVLRKQGVDVKTVEILLQEGEGS